MKTSKRNRFLAALLALVMVATLLPMTALADPAETVTAEKITSLTDLTTGKYVMVTSTGYAPTVYDNGSSPWVTSTAVTNGNSVTVDASLVWTLTVDGTSVKLTDSNGVTIAPKSGNTNGIQSGNYSWTVSCTSGAFQFNGVGEDTTTLASNSGSENKFRSYKNDTVAKYSAYNNQFTLYKVAPAAPDPYAGIDKKYSVYEKVSSLTEGDTVLVYNAGNSVALSSAAAGYNQAGVAMTPNTNGYLTSEVADAAALQWVVGKDADGNYTFTQGEKVLSSAASGTYTNLYTDSTKNTGWKLDVCNAATGSFYVYSAKTESSYGNVYIEWYAAKTGFTAYGTGTSKLTEAAYGMTFYKLVREGVAEEPTGLPADGAKVVIYNEAAEGVVGMQNDNETSPALNSSAATIADGKATVNNGGVVFTVEKNGDWYRFNNENYGYLCSNGTGNNAYYSKTVSEDADWALSARDGGYTMESRTAKFNGQYSQYLEYYSDSYKSYSMYNVTDYSIYTFNFYPVADGTKLYNGVVNNPAVSFTSADSAYLGVDYKGAFTLDDIAAISSVGVSFEGYKDGVAGKGDEIPDVANTGMDYTFTMINSCLNGCDAVKITVTVKNAAGDEYSGTLNVTVLDEPVIESVLPESGSETGTDKRPVISASVMNAGTDPVVALTLNGTAVEATYSDGTVSYTPAEDMADGRVNVSLTLTRTDGKVATRAWNFTVGEAQYQLYFGQLHSHTTYSDGSGTLDAALEYVKALPESANVDFVAFTDHSNYFDTTSSANPEAALYDMSLASAASQATWNEYKSKVAAFNEASAGDIVAVAGFEMTWSGGPGHMNTFNSEGVVSRNNSTLNNKTSDAGMKAYYALLSQAEGADTISQFNHPGSTFGTFSDFSYWDALIDSRIYLVEVGNGEGAIGAGGYYPSYEYYTMALDKGWHVAPTNNQDNHKGKWGNANDARDVILTDNFSEEGIYAAMRDMRIYSTEDKNLEINYTVNGYQLGSSIVEVPEKLDINVSVSDPDGSDSISKVEVIVNSGKTAYTWSDSKELAAGNLSVTLDPDYSYYYIRVTEADGDLAVTAPVWVGESLKLGISSVECGTSTPVTDEELTLTTTLFNSESTEAVIKSLTYTTNGSQVIGTDTEAGTIGASESKTLSFKYTPKAAKVMTVTVTAVLEQDGKEYTFSKDIELDVLNAADLVYIGIDAAHYNEYVAGNYKDSMGNFGTLAAGYSVRTVTLSTSEELIAACSNDKYKMLILTAPSRRLAAAQTDPRTYTAEEIAAIVAFNNAGGSVVLAGWSDYYENYTAITGNSSIKHMAETQNELLAALGSSLRIADNATVDDTLNGGQSQRLYFSSYNFDSALLDGVEYDAEHPNDVLYTERYSQYGGCSIYAVDESGAPTATLPADVTPIVYGHSSTYTKDSDSDGNVDTKYSYADGDDRVLVLASEQQGSKGLVVVAGAAFMSNFEVQATISDNGAEKNYSNYKMCENLVQYINPAKVTEIATVQAQTETGIKYTIEGVVTSNASGYDKDTAFFDCIYVQDATGGICCFPVAGNFKVGDKVRITGTTDFYQGEAELQVSSIKTIGTGEVSAVSATAAQVNDGSVLGQLVTVKGTVTSFELANGLVQTIMVKDMAGNTVRVFIDGYITTAKEVENLKLGSQATVTGLASYDNTFDGAYARIRIRDRADVVCVDGDPFTDIADSGHHDNIVQAYLLGIVNGYGNGTYGPNDKVTRAQFITMLWRAAGSPSASEGYTMTFTDVGKGLYYYDAVAWGSENGIINGYSKTEFGPTDSINRQQMAAFLYRYCSLNSSWAPDTSSKGFSDEADIAASLLDAVNAMANKGVVTGHTDGAFRPHDTATRGQVATVLLRVFGVG